MHKAVEIIKKLLQNVWMQFTMFCGIVWLVLVHLEINRHIKDMIIGYHYWRKSDTYAQISNYYYNGLNFFDHSLYYNQLESGGRAVAEFPLFYYFIAFQQTIFGNYQIIAKINWIILLFIGLFSIFKIAEHYLKHLGFSLLIALILFTSSVYTIYAVDFLPDSIAINLVFSGFWLLLKSTINDKKRTLITAIIILSIAGMMKPFFFIPYIAFIIIVLINQFIFKKEFTAFKWIYLIPFLSTIIWFLYAQWYNSVNSSEYFLSTTKAIWDYNTAEISQTFNAIQSRWLEDYIHPFFGPVFLGLVLINLFWWTRKTILLNLFYLLSIIGCLSFFFLFFNMFEQHDYYIYPILFLIPLTVGKFIFQLKSAIPSKNFLTIFSIATLFLFYLSLTDTFVSSQSRRQSPHINANYSFENYQHLESFLINNDVQKEDFVLTISDHSASFALSLIDRKGWSGYQTYYIKTKISKLIERGTKFLIINKRVELPKIDSIAISTYIDHPIADTNDIFLYDLRPYTLEN